MSSSSSNNNNNQALERHQSTDWCFTFQCQTEAIGIAHLCTIKDACETSGKITYLRVQVERGKEGGNLHLQGWLVAKSRTRWSTLNKILGLEGAHWEQWRGSREDADVYCQKVDTCVFKFACDPLAPMEYTWGEIPRPARRGKVSAKDAYLEEAREDIDSTGKMPKLATMPASILFFSVVEKIGTYVVNTLRYTELKARTHIALVLHGKAGVGKSYTAAKIAEEIFGTAGVLKITVMDRNRLWFPQMSVKPKARCLIIDEFHWGTIAPDQFKALLSGDAPILEVKGGHRPNLFEVVIITTNDDPQKWGAPYKRDGEGWWIPDDSDVEALNRNDNYKAIQYRIRCLDCTEVGWLSEGQDTYAESWAFMEDWLHDALSWAITPDANLRRRIGEGVASQPWPDEDDKEEDGWPSPILRIQAVSNLPSNNKDEGDGYDDKMQPTD